MVHLIKENQNVTKIMIHNKWIFLFLCFIFILSCKNAALGLDVLSTFYVRRRAAAAGPADCQPRRRAGRRGHAQPGRPDAGTGLAARGADRAVLEHPPRRNTRCRPDDEAYLIGPYEELLTVLRRDRAFPGGTSWPCRAGPPACAGRRSRLNRPAALRTCRRQPVRRRQPPRAPTTSASSLRISAWSARPSTMSATEVGLLHGDGRRGLPAHYSPFHSR